jgi:hypothetical protein
LRLQAGGFGTDPYACTFHLNHYPRSIHGKAMIGLYASPMSCEEPSAKNDDAIKKTNMVFLENKKNIQKNTDR